MIEQASGAGLWMGYVFLFFTIAVYACIGVICRTSEIGEYYVAGRRVPALFNGMATAADWMSAATFVGLAGLLYTSGYEGLAYIVGWTGGYCITAFFVAPYLRRFGGYTLPDFIAVRYGGGKPGGSKTVRMVAVFVTIGCSFVYLVAQIHGVGLVVTRFIGVEFAVGVFFELAGILVCSFLGGMRAVTWTQVAQCIILLLAFLIPVSVMGWVKHGKPFPQFTYGSILAQVEAKEKELVADDREQQVRTHFLQEARRYQSQIDRLPASFAEERGKLERIREAAQEGRASLREIKAAEKNLAAFPATPDAARSQWSKQRDTALQRADNLTPTTEPFPANLGEKGENKRLNFFLLVMCLMVGTASLPHFLTRFYTTPSVAEARSSVAWTLFFVALLYISAPTLAILVKYEVLTHLVGSSYDSLPAWVTQWRKLDSAVLSLMDVNGDRIVQWAELSMQPDMVVLAAPEIMGLPYVMSGLLAAGALAAALSTADGLLLAIANAFSHDIYFHVVDPKASNQKRVTTAKIILLGVALAASYVTSLRPRNILFLVGAAFSPAASGFFPVLVLGVFWKRANKPAAIAGMTVGLGVCAAYMLANYAPIAARLGSLGGPWFGIDPIAAGAFGVPAGFLTVFIVSLLTKPNPPIIGQLVDYLRSG
ncbi:MAG: VC_2705 family sodium/solute symporter [Candidatus Protistobacter heckmanni]|nr:VC_2705 family sodium/solute symporter [Candidatus Protistobacter heckmanni]